MLTDPSLHRFKALVREGRNREAAELAGRLGDCAAHLKDEAEKGRMEQAYLRCNDLIRERAEKAAIREAEELAAEPSGEEEKK